MTKFTFGLLLVLLAATPAAATIVYGGQNRQVATTTGPSGGTGTSDVKNTTATGFWSETAASSYSDTNGNASASASQISNLGDFEISMSGTLAAGATLGYVGDAQSFLGATFSIASDTPYASILSSSGPTVNFAFQAAGGNVVYGANSSGTLPAGTYSLSINFRANSGGANSGGPYTYNLSIVPEPSCAVLVMIGGFLLIAARRTNNS